MNEFITKSILMSTHRCIGPPLSAEAKRSGNYYADGQRRPDHCCGKGRRRHFADAFDSNGI